MLQILIVWIYIYITSYCAGRLCVAGLEKLTGNRERKVHPVLYSIVGLIAIMVVAGYFSIFTKTGLLINIILAVFTLVYFLRKRRRILSLKGYTFPVNANTIIVVAFLATVTILVLIKSSGPITTPDSGAYHLPFIKWIENYKVITGLTNVHSRYGFNYQYHVLCAVYGFSFLKIQTIHALNGYLMLALIIYLVTTISYLKTNVLTRLDVVRLIVLFFVLNMSNAASSFSPDFPTTALIILVILITLDRVEAGIALHFDLYAAIVFMVSIGAILFKISSLPVFLFNLFYLIPLAEKKPKAIIWLIAIGAISCMPYLIRNYIMSGYLVYPLYAIDIFNVPWKVPYEKAVFEKGVIRSYALGLKYGEQVSFSEAITSWISYLKTTNRVYIYIIGLLLMCAGINMITLVSVVIRRRIGTFRNHIFLFLLLYVCLVYWWWNAPDPRFGNGYIFLFVAINIAIAGYTLFKLLPSLMIKGSFGLLIVLAVGMAKGKAASKAAINFNEVRYNVFRQEKYPLPDTVLSIRDGEKLFYKVPDDRFCWEAPQPCNMFRDSFDYIGNRIVDGFKPKK